MPSINIQIVMNVKFTLHNHYYKNYTLENIDSVPENIHNFERCFEHNLLRIYQFNIYIYIYRDPSGKRYVCALRAHCS